MWRHLHVAVVGGSDADADTCGRAEAVGRALARRGAVLVCGGLGGVMEAACRGAKAEGGTTLGILPGADRAAANPFVDVAVPTGMGEARNVLVVRASDALVAVGGGFGTLSEIALALRDGKPVVGLDTWELGRQGRAVDGIMPATSPDEAVDLARSWPGPRGTARCEHDRAVDPRLRSRRWTWPTCALSGARLKRLRSRTTLTPHAAGDDR